MLNDSSFSFSFKIMLINLDNRQCLTGEKIKVSTEILDKKEKFNLTQIILKEWAAIQLILMI